MDNKFPFPKKETEAKEEPKPPIKVAESVPQESKRTEPLRIMTELDSIIHERILSQPKLEEIDVKVPRLEATGLHRMSLPEYFEKQSYDCTRGESCKIHKKNEKGLVLNHGKYMFRWLKKDKRSIDYALSVKEWHLVNRNVFNDAPDILFSPNGGVEVGDSILSVMHAERALRLRALPAEKSKDALSARLTVDKKKPNRVLMTGNPDDEHVYMPDLSKEESEGEDANLGAVVADDF